MLTISMTESFILFHNEYFKQNNMNPPKLWGKCAFPRNFPTRKVGEITIFYAVKTIE